MEMEYSTFDRGGQKIMADFGQAEVDWASFCAMPDKIAPVKMPSLFPVPTHIVRRRMTKTVDANHYHKLMWSPEYVYGQGVLVGKHVGVTSDSVYDTVNAAISNLGGVVAAGAVVQKKTTAWDVAGSSGNTYNFDATSPLSDSLSAGGQRLIAAVIEIEYLGKVDNIEGIVEIAMNTNTVNTKHAVAPLEDINFFSEDAIQQAPYYRRFRLSDGIKSIWFPMDESRFSFNECYQTVDHVDPIIQGSGNWQFFDQNATRCFIFPTKNIGQLHATVGNYYLPPGAHQYANGMNDIKTPYRQDNEGLHEKTRIEWAINFTGLTQTCPVRIYINQYYEVIPHESEMDNFFPTLGPVGHTDVATKLIRQVSPGVTPSPANSSGSIVPNVLAKIWEVAKGMGGFITQIPGALDTIGSIAGGVAGGPLGALAGRFVGNTTRSLLSESMAKADQALAKPREYATSIFDAGTRDSAKTLLKPYARR